MNSLINLIITKKTNRKAVFVFPSEAAAESWRKESLRILNQGAIRNDRYISWDSFKESITCHDRTEKPVNSVIRRLFASDIVRRNSSEGPVFKKMIPPEYSGHSSVFSDTVLKILPELNALIPRIQENDFDTDLRADYLLLYDAYKEFLFRNNFFEPSWDFPELKMFDREYHIIFPELIEDFSEYQELLAEAGCSLLRGDLRCGESFSLFENSVIETDELLSSISSLLESGTPPSDIVISSADEQASALLLAKARLRGLPVISRQGQPLSDYPAGRLPELIRECRQSGYSIGSMKSLLIFRAFNWKDSTLVSSLIKFGIENRCLKNTASSVYGDVWASRLKAAGKRELLDFYRRLRKRIEAVTSCGSFEELASEFQVFISTFLDTGPDNWDSGCEQVFQRTREALSSLRDIETGLTDTEVADPLGIWIEILQEKIYVEQQSGPGVTLYPYRVSAGMIPEHHFIIGLSHDSSNITSKSFAFLTDQQRKEIGADENNMTEDFIDIYSSSGSNVRFSGSSETPGGPALPPGRFIEDSQVNRRGEQESFTDPFHTENLWWQKMTGGQTLSGPVLTAVQKEGFRYAMVTYMSDTGFDATVSPIPDGELLSRIISGLSDDNSLLRISASALNRWSDCPFLYFMGDVLNVREDAYILLPEDPMTAGNILHEILFEFFDELKTDGQVFSSAHLEQYRRMIEDKAGEVFDKWENGENYFYGPAWDALKRRAVKSLQLFPAAEAELYDGLKPEHLEAWLEKVFEDEGIKAGGYVDRISTGENCSVIVDYKKSWSKVSKAKFIQFDDEGQLMCPSAGYQLPFYILLAEAQGLSSAASSYYSVAAGRHYPVSGDSGVIDEDDVALLTKLTVSEIKRMAAEVRAGRFLTPERCGGCGLRAVCRKRFNIRWKK
jgi:RecB family exonuclease